MKGKFGIVALLVSSITFAGPVSAPNNLSDTPIISGGGTVSGGTCQAYQTNGTAVSLSGGETLVFYGSGGGIYYYGTFYPQTSGGYLSTKVNYSGTAYVRVKMGNCSYRWGGFIRPCAGGSIGLFAQNTDSKNEFIAGAGAGGDGGFNYAGWSVYGEYSSEMVMGASGGGWYVVGFSTVCNNSNLLMDTRCSSSIIYGGSVYGDDSLWFTNQRDIVPGFHGSRRIEIGAASSISAFYNSYTKNYTSFATSLTISGGGHFGRQTPTLYICQ
ncbi:hypothetical protein [Thermocrinis sp.]|jgi:hypothetical protein|uniref:hypothetical protein n=1 Tax=Thermocrinis sp. TaxID=2024383 RepID=UPI003C0299FB